jgi:hypothetical protein
MRRAGIFVGVDRTGQLQTLSDAAAGAERMHRWALAQGMSDKTQAILITDKGGAKVTPDMIYDAIKSVIDGPGVDHLLVYFAGHGVNINRSEHWLLSDAPVRTSAAVNVAGSVDLARYCGIPYVAFISDACRTAPEGIQAQNVRGVDVFPNDGASDRAQPVDQFFACRLGKTAAEIRDPAEAAKGFLALYTTAFLDAVSGQTPSVLEAGTTAGDAARYVMPAKLRDFLETEMPRRIVAARLAARVNQSPDAIVLAHANWLARVDNIPQLDQLPEAPAITRRSTRRAPSLELPEPAGAPAPETAVPFATNAAMRELVRVAVTASPTALSTAISNAAAVPGIIEMAATAAKVAEPFGPDSHETQCGIKTFGARIAEFVITQGRAEFANAQGNDLRVFPSMMAESVLLVFADGNGTVVPVVPGFLTALTFDAHELVDVALEPSANHPRWYDYQARVGELRALRGFVSAASQLGRFRLEGPEALTIAQRMQWAKGIDPALALYAAYAYRDLQQLDRLREMSSYLRDDLGSGLFDVAMLARELRGKAIDRTAGVVPFVPMLAQGWDLVESSGVRLHPKLEGVRGRVAESLWSLYDRAGVALLRDALKSGEVR